MFFVLIFFVVFHIPLVATWIHCSELLVWYWHSYDSPCTREIIIQIYFIDHTPTKTILKITGTMLYKILSGSVLAFIAKSIRQYKLLYWIFHGTNMKQFYDLSIIGVDAQVGAFLSSLFLCKSIDMMTSWQQNIPALLYLCDRNPPLTFYLCDGNPPLTCRFPSQRACIAARLVLYVGPASIPFWTLGPVNSSHKGPVTRKMFPFDDVIMCF